MCGRFTVTSPEGIATEFGVVFDAPPRQRFNVAPTQAVAAVVERSGTRQLDWFRWGLVPPWAGDTVAAKMINARSESAAEKPAFRSALRHRRCLVVADGFYEWKRDGKRKVPFYICTEPQRLFGFAGLWEQREREGGAPLLSCAILTAPANALVAPIHDRMPVVIDREAYGRWLSPDPLPPELAAELLRAPKAEGWTAYEVSPLVNAVANDSPECVRRGPVQGRLFDL